MKKAVITKLKINKCIGGWMSVPLHCLAECCVKRWEEMGRDRRQGGRKGRIQRE